MAAQSVCEKRKLRKPTKRKPLRQLYTIARYDPHNPKAGPSVLSTMMFDANYLADAKQAVAKWISEQTGDDRTVVGIFRWHETDGLIGLPIPRRLYKEKWYVG